MGLESSIKRNVNSLEKNSKNLIAHRSNLSKKCLDIWGSAVDVYNNLVKKLPKDFAMPIPDSKKSISGLNIESADVLESAEKFIGDTQLNVSKFTDVDEEIASKWDAYWKTTWPSIYGDLFSKSCLGKFSEAQSKINSITKLLNCFDKGFKDKPSAQINYNSANKDIEDICEAIDENLQLNIEENEDDKDLLVTITKVLSLVVALMEIRIWPIWTVIQNKVYGENVIAKK